MRDYRIYLADILSAIESIESFVEGMDFETFQSDDKTSSAVIRKFEIMGEAAKQVPIDVVKNNPEIPWKEMAGMRDKLIHSYFGVNISLVWQTVKNRLPQIKPLISGVITELRDD